MDLDWAYYLAVNILGLSEKEFFESTPKKIFKLAEIHQKVNNNNSNDGQQKEVVEEKYIDEIW